MSYNQFSIWGAKPSYCSAILEDYDQSLSYPAGICVESEGGIWYATVQVDPQNQYLPNGWYDIDSDEVNDNPCVPVYPWYDGQKIVDLMEESVEEGTCGHGPNGVPGKTPGGTKGMPADDRTRTMLKKFIQQEVKDFDIGEEGVQKIY